MENCYQNTHGLVLLVGVDAIHLRAHPQLISAFLCMHVHLSLHCSLGPFKTPKTHGMESNYLHFIFLNTKHVLSFSVQTFRNLK